MKWNALLFDMDGLMFETERMSDECWLEFGHAHGYDITPDWICCLRGTNYNDGEILFKQRFGEDVPYAAWSAQVFAALEERLAQHVPLCKNLLVLLEAAKERGIPMAVVSSTHHKMVMDNLHGSNTAHYFAHVITGDMVEHSKPEPDIYLLAAKTLGVAPETCMVLEDSYNGVRAGSAAGCYTVMVPNMDAPTPEILALANIVVPDLGAVINLL